MDDDVMIFPPNQNESSAPASLANVSFKIMQSDIRNQPKISGGKASRVEDFESTGLPKLCLDNGRASH